MKLFSTKLILCSLLLLVYPLLVLAEQDQESNATPEFEEKSFVLDLSTSFFSDYFFRGQNLYPGTSIQPEIAASYSFGDYGALNGSIWGHLSAENNDDQAERFTETDFTISYDIPFDILTLTLGPVWYTYPDDDGLPESAEYFASLAVDTILTPTFSFYKDYREYDNEYYEISFSQEVECACLGEGFNFTPSAALGFASNAEKIYSEDSGLMFVGVGLSSDLALGDITVTPTLNYNFKVDDASVNTFWMGMTFGYSI